jgi:uncharacterized protein YdeI (YjbR/CyaY-like superfamily)
MITDIEDFFASGCGRCARFDTPDCSTRKWAEGLAALRRICRAAGLDERVKWGHPCYMHAGRNIAIIGAFRGDFRLTFFDAALMADPRGVLEPAGPNTRHAGTIRFTDNARVADMEPVIRSCLTEAMDHAAAGRRPPKDDGAPDLPDELVEALDHDPKLAEAFHRLTPGRQKSYAIHLASARSAATRVARIARLRGKILAGKGATER